MKPHAKVCQRRRATIPPMDILWWFLAEAFGAAILVALLVWWTWPKTPKTRNNPESDGKDQEPR